ncbi:hypothetical protein F5883DRAFT_177209 [Diaporthe sp. PMI_573]|nr:hypothetical protein F5883DRAFT_177209 [Diaporthaceae sp. PMI_573]
MTGLGMELKHLRCARSIWVGFSNFFCFLPPFLFCFGSVAGQLDGLIVFFTRLLVSIYITYYTPYTASIDTEALLFFFLVNERRVGTCVAHTPTSRIIIS